MEVVVAAMAAMAMTVVQERYRERYTEIQREREIQRDTKRERKGGGEREIER